MTSIRYQGRRDDVRRRRRGVGGAYRSRRNLAGAVRRRRLRHPVGAAGARHPRDGHVRRDVAVHQPLARGGVDLTGKRVGVIGTGSTGVQLIPVVARDALHLSVFQRSPAYTLPWRVHRFEPGELDEMKSRYGEIRAAQRAHPIGAARLSAFSVLLDMLGRPR